MSAAASVQAGAVTVSFDSSTGQKPVEIIPEKSTGLDRIYVVPAVEGLKMTIDTGSAVRPVVSRYSTLGGGYAEVTEDFVFSGTSAVFQSPQGDMGYIVESEGKRFYFWLTDYSAHRFSVSSIEPSDEADCMSITLDVEGNGSPIHYYGISGRQMVLSRGIILEYNTLEWDSGLSSYNYVHKEQEIESFGTSIVVTPPPFCNTEFRISGDRFSETWGDSQHAVSREYITQAVDAETSAEQLNVSSDDKSNQIGSDDGSGLGGSAPALIRFSAQTTDAVIHDEWQIARDSEFEYIDYRFNEKEIEYDFREEGRFFVRYVGSNSDGSCTVVSETYEVNIGASELVCPNAFSPGASEGVNDEWKVSYRSLVEFKCWIFDRYGTEMYHFENPDLGWDGRYRGKLVKPGVYFYVIEALGADGKKYKKSGDINILNFKHGTGYNTDEN